MGMSTMWQMMPGMAEVTAPAQKADRGKVVFCRPASTNWAQPHTTRPSTMAPTRETYT